MEINFDAARYDVNAEFKPTLGMDATICYITDSHPARIVAWKRNKQSKVTHVEAQIDDAKIISGSTMDGSAEYEYSENKENPKCWFRLRKNGRWVKVSQGLNNTPSLTIGRKRKYHDPSF